MRAVILCCAALLACACDHDNQPVANSAPQTPSARGPNAPSAGASPEFAIAHLQPTRGQDAFGTLIVWSQGAQESGLHISGTVVRLSPGSTHGLHIHEQGDCSAPDASGAGGHFNPLDNPHGAPGENTHLGDLGNIKADSDGTAKVVVKVAGGTLDSGASTDVIGKAFILHAKADDLKTQPDGAAGDRIACGVIERNVLGARSDARGNTN
jgi:superoxide dismutase, Cu-Zn family